MAILFVVAVHTAGELDWPAESPVHRLLIVLFQDATLLFFILSGYLFHHLSSRFEYRRYLASKFKNVALPFLVISAPGIGWLLAKPYFLLRHPELADKALWQQVLFLLAYAGEQMAYPLWFVPVMLTFFVAAPAFKGLIALPGWQWVLVLLVPVSLAMHRPEVTKYHHWEQVVYYASPYVLGMWLSENRERVNELVDRNLPLLTWAYVALLVGQFTLIGQRIVDSFAGHFALEWGYIDWFYVQKALAFLVMLGLARKLQHCKTPVLDYLGTVSFPIFFLHAYLLRACGSVLGSGRPDGSVLMFLTGYAMALGGSVALAYMSRLTFGRKSRYLVGA